MEYAKKDSAELRELLRSAEKPNEPLRQSVIDSIVVQREKYLEIDHDLLHDLNLRYGVNYKEKEYYIIDNETGKIIHYFID